MPRRRWMHALLWEDLTSLTSGSSIAWVARSGSSALFGGDRLLFRAPTLPVGFRLKDAGSLGPRMSGPPPHTGHPRAEMMPTVGC
jgi:hypothetical protein